MYEWSRNKENTASEKVMADLVHSDGDCRVNIESCGDGSFQAELSFDNPPQIYDEDADEWFTPEVVSGDGQDIDMEDAKTLDDAERIADEWLTENNIT